MKKIYRFAAMILTLVFLPFSVFAEYEVDHDEPEKYNTGSYTWILLEDDTAEIVSYTGSDEEVTVPSALEGKTVTAIGNGAFSGRWWHLKSVILPESISRIGTNPFTGCDRLEKITVPENHPYMATVFGMLYSKPDKRLICCPAGFAAPILDVPEGTRIIGANAFDGCNRLTAITMPDTVMTIEKRAFDGCTSLRKISLPETMTAIGDHLFDGCKMIKEIRIPESVTSIGEFAFHQCTALKEIVIPGSVTSIGSSAFSSCEQLTDISIPGSVTSIGDLAFISCTGLMSVTIPDSVTFMGANPFAGCSALKEIRVSENHPYLNHQDGILFTKDDNRLVRYPDFREEEEYSIPEGTESIAAYAFADCSHLVSVSVPDSVTTIGENAFSGCSHITKMKLPSALTDIGDQALPSAVFSNRESFPGAESLPEERVSVQEFSLPASAKIYPQSGKMYTLMPISIRTTDPDEADYCFVSHVRNVERYDYIGGSAHNTITELYVCDREGSVILICSILHEPPRTGVVMKGQSLGGSVADEDEIWETVSSLFPDS